MDARRQEERHGGDIIADVLVDHGVPYVFTLCGGHISPILVGAKARGIDVIDTRDEANAAFAADAVARMTGIPGVAAVTAGPGLTNAVTALKNAQMAQTPMIIFGGATATILRGRGSLQDIDQIALMKPCVKWVARCTSVSSLRPTLEQAFEVASSGVPGPVFVEIPVDLLYPEEVVREWYLKESGLDDPEGLLMKAAAKGMEAYLYKQFHLPSLPKLGAPRPAKMKDESAAIRRVAERVRGARKPMLVVGSQTLVGERNAEGLADAVRSLGLPTWLGGTARGLLGRHSEIQFRHKRSKSMREADLCIVAGFPFDFRMKYGRGFGKHTQVVAANLNPEELTKNKTPDEAILIHPAEFLRRLAAEVGPGPWSDWFDEIRAREAKRDDEILAKANPEAELVDPLDFFVKLEAKMDDDAVLVVDGGDFVATAAYILRPRQPLRWLDPGVFGTLGVGGGFALGASVVYPGSEIWIIYGDGSSAYSIAEFDTYCRHGMAPIAVIGTDGSWAQIARDQVSLLGDAVGTELVRNDYHVVAEGYGGKGLLLTDPAKVEETLDEAKAIAAEGKPVCLNVHIAKSDFREGSISI